MLADECRGGHLTAGHAINCVVHENDRKIFSPRIAVMHDFRRAD